MFGEVCAACRHPTLLYKRKPRRSARDHSPEVKAVATTVHYSRSSTTTAMMIPSAAVLARLVNRTAARERPKLPPSTFHWEVVWRLSCTLVRRSLGLWHNGIMYRHLNLLLLLRRWSVVDGARKRCLRYYRYSSGVGGAVRGESRIVKHDSVCDAALSLFRGRGLRASLGREGLAYYCAVGIPHLLVVLSRSRRRLALGARAARELVLSPVGL